MQNETTVMTDKQFALQQAVNVYREHYKKGSFGIGPLFHKVAGQAAPNETQVEGVLKLAYIFEKHLKNGQ